jgi:26S proteasome regulatory subunit T6
VHPEGKYVVDCDKSIDISTVKPAARVALRNDSYALHVLLPSKVDPLVSLMKVEKVPDSTYDMVGGLDQQVRARALLLRAAARVRTRATTAPLLGLLPAPR